MFCQYKNLFGEPGKGVHAYRLFDIAIVDVLLTVLLGMVITHVFSLSLIYTIIGLFLLSIVMHRMFCVRTKVDRFLFG